MDIGAQLRSAREAHGLSIGSMAQRTRVQPRILTAIEENDLRTIPPKPFGRGFVRAYAREVGLDPEQTVHDYFGQFPPIVPAPPPKTPDYEPPRTTSWFVPLAGLAVLVVLVASALRGGKSATDQVSASEAVGTSGTSSPSVVQPDAVGTPTPAPAKATPSAVPATQPSELNVMLTANENSWISATADGHRVVYRLLAAGSQESLRATREIVVLAGNAGGVSLTINGRTAGNVGRPGEVRTVRINLSNAASIGQPGRETR